jgi:hypothetical protein
MKNLFKFAALGLALTAGLSSCGDKKAEETTTVETPAATTETTTTTTTATDTTAMAPAAEGAMAPAAPAAEGAMAPAAGTTTTTEEVKK